jgi:hypothetical protein
METDQKQINKIKQEGFDEKTKLKIQVNRMRLTKSNNNKRYPTTKQNISNFHLTGNANSCTLQGNLKRKKYPKQTFKPVKRYLGNTKFDTLLNAMILQHQQ